MANWVKEVIQTDRLEIGRAYSRKELAEKIGASAPGSRDWGGIVQFANAVAIFVTLEKAEARYAQEHRYNDQFDQDLLYWESRASHEKSSKQTRQLREQTIPVFAFARLREKELGQTQPFYYLGPLEFVSWWGSKPVHFTWRLTAYPQGLGGSSALDAIATWRPGSEGRR